MSSSGKVACLEELEGVGCNQEEQSLSGSSEESTANSFSGWVQGTGKKGRLEAVSEGRLGDHNSLRGTGAYWRAH